MAHANMCKQGAKRGEATESARCRFLMRLPLTQEVLYSSQVAPRAAQVRVHFHGLVEEGLCWQFGYW